MSNVISVIDNTFPVPPVFLVDGFVRHFPGQLVK